MKTIMEFQKSQKLMDEYESLNNSLPELDDKINKIDERIKVNENQAKLRCEKLVDQKQLTFQDVEFEINPDDLRKEIDKKIEQEKKKLAKEYEKSDKEKIELQNKKSELEDKIKYFRTDSNIKTITVEIKEMQKEVDKCKLEIKKIDMVLQEYYMEVENNDKEQNEHKKENQSEWKKLYDQRDTFNENIKSLNTKIEEYAKFKETLLGIELKPEEYKKLNEIDELSKKQHDNEQQDNEKIENNEEIVNTTDNPIKDKIDISFKNARPIVQEKPDIKFGDNKNELEQNEIDSKPSNEILKNVQREVNKEYVNQYNGQGDTVKIGINGNNIVYQFENEPDKKKEWPIKDFKKHMKDIKNTGRFGDKSKNSIEPYLLNFVYSNFETNNYIAMIEQMDKGQGLDESFQSIVEYDMAGAKELGFRERWQLRKIAKTAQNLNLKVENAEEIKFSFKNDVLRGLGDLFKGTIKGLTAGKTETQALLEESKVKELTEKEMEELKQREGIETEQSKHEAYVEELSKAANKKESNESANINYNAKFIDHNNEIVTTNNEVQNNDKER